MPAKPSGEIKTRIIKNTQKNGDIYVLERQTIYDPAKKYNNVISSKLIAKISKGSDEQTPTRPKRASSGSEVRKIENSASRTHIGMMDIIGHIGAVSGIDKGIYDATDIGTAQKIISLARYLLATNGQSLPGILTWQYNHPLPYAEGMSEEIYHELFNRIGRNESLQQMFFLSRCRGLGEHEALAYDSTSISTYSENQIDARYGFNKAGDGLKTIKLLTLYSIESRQPIAFTKQPGNLPDVITIANALKQLSALGINHAEIVTDNGYYSEQNLSEFFQAGFDFLTLVKTSVKWVRAEIDSHMEAFNSISSVYPFDVSTHGITVLLKRGFKKTRKYASNKNKAQKGDEEIFSRRIYLSIYFNSIRQAEDKIAFERSLFEIKTLIESGIPVPELSDEAQSKVKRYMSVKCHAGKAYVNFDDKACGEAYKYHGYFALVSNKEKEPFECLRKYRRRETIESFFEAGKQHADGLRTRVWNTDTLRGRMFVQFVSLCYYEYFSEQVRKLKVSLGKETGDAEHDTKTIIDTEKKLKSWLENTPLYLQLQWFDTVESINISSVLSRKRWNTEVTSRDKLYLDKLGVKIN